LKKILVSIFIAGLFISCHKDPDITDVMLDSGLYFDQSLYQPEKYLVSAAKPTPTAIEAQMPVVIAVHGYGSTTFEWDEFRTWARARIDLDPAKENFQISQVLLGGHGRDYQSFRNASWRDWRKPIIDEYEKLENAGYTNISLAGSSTGCTLILEMLSAGYFNSHVPPKHIFLIDPIIIPSAKTLSLVSILGPIIGYTEVDNTAGEEKYYYHYRPYETLQELRNIITIVRKDLEEGITLPAGCTLKVFKSDKDKVVDPVSAVLIYLGMRTNSGEHIEVSMIPSNLHVYTRLDVRESTPTPADYLNQSNTFNEIAETIIK
jgi:carboxylesterase